jgi:hypothetical protein
MMEVSTDFAVLGDSNTQVLLFCVAGRGIETAVVAHLHWFPTKRPNERRLGWRVTWDGREIPEGWAPYAYAIIKAPDPALAEDGY